MAKVLVTGASGFIGSRLTRRLIERGDDVCCLVRSSAKAAPLAAIGARTCLGDVRDEGSLSKAVDGVDVVYHLAGLTAAFTAEELLEVNARGLGRLAGACAARQTPPTLVYVSSLAAAGPSAVDRPRSEADPAVPVSHYGRAKRAAEETAETFAAKLPITIVRPPIVFGEGDRSLCPVFRSIARYRIFAAVGVAAHRYSLIHVWDLVDGLIFCAQRGERLPAAKSASPESLCAAAASGYYFVAHDEQPTFAQIGALIGRSLDRDAVLVFGARMGGLLWPAAAVMEVISRARGQQYIFNFDKVREARAGHWICSSAAIRQRGCPPPQPIQDRFRETTQWYREQKWI